VSCEATPPDVPGQIPGWICCKCHGYNGQHRLDCRNCEHTRCDVKHVAKVTSGLCPFCAAHFSVDWSHGPQGALFHALPMCRKFAELSGDDFMRAVLRGEHRS